MPQNRANGRASPKRVFYGWYIVAAAFVTLGLAVGVPYYNLPFFYDYFQRAYHWDLGQITLGLPLASVLTIWVGPALVPRCSPRKLIIAGTGLMVASFFGFSAMRGALSTYFLLYFVYMGGYILAGPIPHQMLISYWFDKRRGSAMGMMYVGIGFFGGLGSVFVHSITRAYGFKTALVALGVVMFLAWPIAFFILKDRPSEIGQFPDNAATPKPETKAPGLTFARLLHSGSFWLLTMGSVCSIGAIGCINLHMKFVFRDAGFRDQRALDAVWTSASVLILWASIAGRLGAGYLADIFSKKTVMIVTYLLVGAASLLLLSISPARDYYLYAFAIVFGLSLGADYMLIPLMAAEQFGVNTLARAMAIILPVNTIGQTWCPYLVSKLREESGSYTLPMTVVFFFAVFGALAVAVIPKSDLPAFARATVASSNVSAPARK